MHLQLAQMAAHRQSTRLACTLPWLAVGVLAVLYGATVAPFPWPGDPAEFTTAAVTLGIAHPTGYPLYVVMGHLATRLLFFLDPALVTNALSAVYMVVALAVLVGVLRRLEVAPGVSAATILVVGSTAGLWGNAGLAEVYTLHLLIAVVLVDAVLRARHSDSWWRPLLPWFLAGLSMANHMTSVLYFPGLLVWEISRRPGVELRERIRGMSLAVVAAMLGASAIALLLFLDRPDALNYINQYAREFPHPRFSSPWRRLLWLETGAQYGATTGVARTVLSLDIAGLLLRLGGRVLEDSPVLVCGGALGTLLAVARPSKLRVEAGPFRFTALTILLVAVYFAGYSRSHFNHGFFTVGYVYLSLGLALVVDRGVKALGVRRIVVGALVASAITSVITHRDLLCWRDGRVYIESNRAFLSSIEPDAVVLSTWGNSSLFWYLRWVEGLQPGVLVLNSIRLSWPRLISTYAPRPIYLEVVPDGADPALFEEHHHFYRFGHYASPPGARDLPQ